MIVLQHYAQHIKGETPISIQKKRNVYKSKPQADKVYLAK